MHPRLLFVALFMVIAGSATAQNTGAYYFIEPNVSLTYDSTHLKFRQKFTNSVRDRETYMFSYNFPNRNKTYVQISTDLPAKNADQKYKDSVCNALIRQMNRFAGDSMIIKSTRPIHYKGFSGYGFITMHKRTKEYLIALSCIQFLEDGLCKVFYTSYSKSAIDNLDKDYATVTALMDGLAFYQKKDLEQEEQLIKQKYTIVVDSIGKPSGFPIEATYFGMLKVKEKLENKLLGAEVGIEVFFPDYKNDIIIYCSDADKGRIEKNGELMMLSKAGKLVRIPFKFAYFNK